MKTWTVVIMTGQVTGTLDKTTLSVPAIHQAAAVAEALLQIDPQCDADAQFLVYVEPGEDEGDVAIDFGDLPRPQRDDRDPYGNLERHLLHEKTGTWDHDVHTRWKTEHPEFAAEYQALLERTKHP